MSDTGQPRFPGRTDWHTARHASFAAPHALKPESVPLAESVGRTLAADVVALCDVPHYASSAMDGWAVAGAAPWRIVRALSLEPGQAAAIVTGGLVPAGSQGVLRSEHATLTEDGKSLQRGPHAASDEPHQDDNVRPAGEEVRSADTVIRAGTRLNPAHASVAAVCGHDSLPVLPRPRVGLILTGDEVVESGIPEPGHVRDTFGPALPAFVSMLGGMVTHPQRIRDGLELLITAIGDAADTDVVITTGGTGASPADYLHDALHRLGADVLIDGVAMRPGGPSLLARLVDGRFLVGLPGNPLAAMMGLLTLAQPLLAGLAGAAEPGLGTVVTGRELTGRPGLDRLLPYRLQDGVALKSQWFGSGMLRGLAEADGVLIAPTAGARTGESVATVPLPW